MAREHIIRLKQVDMLKLYEAMKQLDFSQFYSDTEIHTHLMVTQTWDFQFSPSSVKTIRNSMNQELGKPLKADVGTAIRLLAQQILRLQKYQNLDSPNELIYLAREPKP